MKKIAIPIEGNELSHHFGHCEKFAFVQVEDDQIIDTQFIIPPAHKPGVYPRFLIDNNVNTIIAGKMGQNAQKLLSTQGIEIIMGIESGKVDEVVGKYLKNELVSVEVSCNHDH